VKPGSFYCNGVQANGCYGAGLIKWNVKTPQVIRHEAGHAILHKLREKYWYCYEHGVIAKDECPIRLAYPEKSGC